MNLKEVLPYVIALISIFALAFVGTYLVLKEFGPKEEGPTRIMSYPASYPVSNKPDSYPVSAPLD